MDKKRNGVERVMMDRDRQQGADTSTIERNDAYKGVEGVSERRTGRGCEELGAVLDLSLSAIGREKGGRKGGEDGCDLGLGGLCGGTVTTTDPNATGGSGSDGDAPRL